MRLAIAWWFAVGSVAWLGGAYTQELKPIPAGDGEDWKNIVREDDIASLPRASRAPQLVVDSLGFSGLPIHALELSRDGRWLAAAGGKVVRVWDLRGGQLHATLRGFQEPHGYMIGNINDMAFSPDGHHLVVAVSDNTQLGSTRVYDLRRPDRIHRLLDGHTGCTRGVAFSPGGDYLATFGCDGYVYFLRWDAERGDAEVAFRHDLDAKDKHQAGSPSWFFGFPWNDEWLLMRQWGFEVLISVANRKPVERRSEWPAELLDWSEQERRARLPGDPLSAWATTPGWFDLSSDLWYAKGGMDPSMERAYWAAVWRKGADAPAAVYKDHRFFPTAVTLNPRVGMAASADQFGEVHVWNASTAEPLHRFCPVSQEIYRVAWSEDGASLLFADAPYPTGVYHYNRFGPINREFHLRHRYISDCSACPPDAPVYPARYDARTGRRAELTPVRDEFAPVVHGEARQEVRYNLQLAFKPAVASSPAMLFDCKSFGRPYAFCFAQAAPSNAWRLSSYLGTFEGHLFLLGLRPDGPGGNESFEQQCEFVGHGNAVTSVAESPDGRLLATSSLDGTIRIWPIRAVRTTYDIPFSVDGNRVLYISEGSQAYRAGIRQNDLILRFDGLPFYERLARMAEEPHDRAAALIEWTTESGELKSANVELRPRPDLVNPLVSLFLAQDGEWVIWTEKGFYDASANGGRYVGWHVNQGRHEPAKFHTIDQFRSTLYKPLVIDEVLVRGDLDHALAAIRERFPDAPFAPLREDIREPEVFSDFRPPEVHILAPDSGTTVNADSVLIDVEILSPNRIEIAHVDIRVNGRAQQPIDSSRTEEETEAGRLVKLRQRVKLFPDTNVVSVEATNSKHLTDEASVKVERSSRSTLHSTPTLYVLAIGLSDYGTRHVGGLDYAHQDAEDFAAACLAQQEKAFAEVKAVVLTDEDATADRIRDAMDEVARLATKKEDAVFVLVSGHGYFDQFGTWRLPAYGFDPAGVTRSSIGYHEFIQWIDHQIGAQVVFFVDTCHAGGVRGDSGFKSVHPAKIDPWQGRKTLIFASSRADEVSKEDAAWKNGAFTEAILEAFTTNRADGNGDGLLKVTELEMFLENEVPQLTDGAQHPTCNKHLNSPDLVFALVE